MAYALPKNIAALKRDLGRYRIDYDVWFHESTLHESGAVAASWEKLLELGCPTRPRTVPSVPQRPDTLPSTAP